MSGWVEALWIYRGTGSTRPPAGRPRETGCRELASGQEVALPEFSLVLAPIGSGAGSWALQLLSTGTGLSATSGVHVCEQESKMSGLWQDHEPQGWPAPAATSRKLSSFLSFLLGLLLLSSLYLDGFTYPHCPSSSSSSYPLWNERKGFQQE